jgi:hypothetical protein
VGYCLGRTDHADDLDRTFGEEGNVASLIVIFSRVWHTPRDPNPA